MTESSVQHLNLWDTTSEIEARFSQGSKAKARLALIKDGASDERAALAIEMISKACASYIAFGPFEPVPELQIKAEIAAVAKAAEQFNRAMNAMSVAALARLNVDLWPERRLLWGGKSPRFWNPDPIYESPQHVSGTTGALNLKVKVPADMSAKLNRVRFDLFQLAPLIRRAAEFRPRRGRPENWRVRALFEEVIIEWARAADQAPAASQQEGMVVSPLLDLLRELVYPATDHPEVGEALSDPVYLDVLAKLKKRRVGLLSQPVIPPRRRRKQAQA
jgi:hypothetical protein